MLAEAGLGELRDEFGDVVRLELGRWKVAEDGGAGARALPDR
jgi:hypothetical protein